MNAWDQEHAHLFPAVWPPVEKPVTYRQMHSAVEPLRIRTMLYERDYDRFPVVPKVKTGKVSDLPEYLQKFCAEEDARLAALDTQRSEW